MLLDSYIFLELTKFSKIWLPKQIMKDKVVCCSDSGKKN
jgi:hypothetical protein